MDALIQEALDFGFSQAGAFDAHSLIFIPEVREMCNEETCNKYNKNWRCPPGCESVQEAEKRARQYNYGIVLQTIGHLEDDFDIETISETKKGHQKSFYALVEKLRHRYLDILPLSSDACSICEKCTFPDNLCRFPERAISPMEAYGLMVNKVCTLAGLRYYYGKLTLTFTSCYLLK
jgi:predicted metal-binding protein